MIDILTGTDGAERLTGTESKKGAWISAILAILILAGAAAGGAYWFRTHHKSNVIDIKASEQAVRDAGANWSHAAQAHDMGAFNASYADDATLLPANSEMITSKAGVTKYWMDTLTKDVTLSRSPMYVEVAKSGDIAYVLGSYSMTAKPAKGAKGGPVADHGKYMSVWKQQADGSWKAEADTWNSDLPSKK